MSRQGRGRNRAWAVRTIKNGKVRIFGVMYEPARELIPDRLNGTSALFHIYIEPNGSRLPLAALWGPEYWMNSGELDDWPGPFCEDGIFKWECWKPVEEER